MKLDLLYLEDGNQLYAGYGFNEPVLKWSGKAWEPWKAPEAKADGWAVRLTRKEAERCFPGCSASAWPDGYPASKEFPYEEMTRLRPDLFDSYDNRNLRRSPKETEALDQLMPQALKDLRAKRQSDG